MERICGEKTKKEARINNKIIKGGRKRGHGAGEGDEETGVTEELFL